MFPRSISWGKRNKSKNKQTGPNQTCNLLHSKGNYQKTKRQPVVWEKSFANDDVTGKDLISKIYK